MARRCWALCVALTSLCSLTPLPAFAYCYSGLCPGDGSREQVNLCSCDGAPEGECSCPADLFTPKRLECLDDGSVDPLCIQSSWPTGCTGYSVHKDGFGDFSAKQIRGYVRQAFDSWMNVDCGEGEPPGIQVIDMGFANCRLVEQNPQKDDGKDVLATIGKGNANIIVGRPRGVWPYPEEQDHVLAFTTLTFSLTTGEILGADLELNGDYTFTDAIPGEGSLEVHLQSVLTHEVGHFLGIQHSDVKGSTMQESYRPDGSMAVLADDDQRAICRLYPPDPKLTAKCNPLPKHGYSPDCAIDQLEGTCALAANGWRSPGLGTNASGPQPRGRILFAFFAIALAAVVRFVRSRSPARTKLGCGAERD